MTWPTSVTHLHRSLRPVRIECWVGVDGWLRRHCTDPGYGSVEWRGFFHTGETPAGGMRQVREIAACRRIGLCMLRARVTVNTPGGTGEGGSRAVGVGCGTAYKWIRDVCLLANYTHFTLTAATQRTYPARARHGGHSLVTSLPLVIRHGSPPADHVTSAPWRNMPPTAWRCSSRHGNGAILRNARGCGWTEPAGITLE